MPLPVGGSDPWPPPDLSGLLADTRAWAAWWSGDMAELQATAGNDMDRVNIPDVRERQFNLGPGHRRRFWQRRADLRDPAIALKAEHAPLASDIAETSADLLFGEQPDLTLPLPELPDLPPADLEVDPTDPAAAEAAAELQAQHAERQARVRQRNADAQGQLEDLLDKVALWPRLLEGAEVCSAVGGVYLRPAWDREIADHPLSQVVEQDRAIPDFRWGRLVAVTFWEEVAREGKDVWRHLERHEPGVILHGLYRGTPTLLGDKVALAAHPATRHLDDTVVLPQGMPRPLLVSYVPNVLPNRRHRRLAVGRSDYAGVEPQLDSLDEVWTSWMRDIRLGQARVVVPNEFLTPAGTRPGDGKTLDLDKELFTGLEIAEVETLTDPIKLIQPDLRVEAHAATVVALVKSIVSAAGYSPQTFGLDIEGMAESGTALRIREKKTLHTTNRKRGYWKGAVEEHVENLAALNAALFGGPAMPRPLLDWPDLTDDPESRANTASIWRSAQAMSIRTAVKMRDPGLTEEEVDAEVQAITDEKAASMPVLDLPPAEDEGDSGGSGNDDVPE